MTKCCSAGVFSRVGLICFVYEWPNNNGEHPRCLCQSLHRLLILTTSNRAEVIIIKLQSLMIDAETWALDNNMKFLIGKTELVLFHVKEYPIRQLLCSDSTQLLSLELSYVTLAFGSTQN